jgi:hypothetical protein
MQGTSLAGGGVAMVARARQVTKSAAIADLKSKADVPPCRFPMRVNVTPARC